MDRLDEGAPKRPGQDVAGVIAADNKVTRYHLIEQLRSPLGVIPFVGAGISVPFRFPAWGQVLREAAAAEGPSVAAQVEKLLSDGEYEEEADALLTRNEDHFQRRVETEYGRPIEKSELESGTVAILPRLASGPVITTNFDQILEAAFEHAGAPFHERIMGAEPDRIVKALHRNTHALALFSFNVGIELGQLAFITAFLLLTTGLRRLPLAWPRWSPAVPAYGIRILATFWFVALVGCAPGG